MLTENTVLLAKIEATYGTDPTPLTTANFIRVHNVSITPNVTYHDTMGQDVSLSPLAGTLGQKYYEITFDHELIVDNVSTTTPPCDPLLLSCGFDDSDSDGVYVPYTIYPSGLSSCTIWVYFEDILYKMTGCRGNVEFNLTAGSPAILSFTLQGLYQAPSDSTFPTSVTDTNFSSPLVCMGGSFDWDSSHHPCIESLAFSLNNTMAQRPCMTTDATHGIGGIEITNRMPEGSFNPEMVKTTTDDFQTHFAELTQTAIAYALTNGTVDVDISLPKTEIMNITPGDRNGVRIYDIPFRCVRSSGDDEISITVAAT